MTGRDVIGLRLRPDGTAEPLTSPEAIDDAVKDLATDLSTARVSGHHDRELVMFIADDRGATNALNPAATELHGTGWPVVGDAVLAAVDHLPLPHRLLERHLNESGAPAPEPRVLDWDEHLDSRDHDCCHDAGEQSHQTGDVDDVAERDLHCESIDPEF